MGVITGPEWTGIVGKKTFLLFFLIQLIVFISVVFYFGGIKRYGSLSDFQSRREGAANALRDSLRSAELETPAPENTGDSTMHDLGNHMRLFEKTEENELRIQRLQAMIDSLQKEKEELSLLRDSVVRQSELIHTIQEKVKNDNLAELARMFEAMKPQEAIPIMLELNDSLTVNILTRMQSRSSAKLLGALALTDTTKAVRISRLFAKMGVPEVK